MLKIPFSIYDFFGYLASGFLLSTAINNLFQVVALTEGGVTIFEYTLMLIVVYIIGHINSSFASWFLEKSFVDKLLRSPHVVILQTGQPRFKLFKYIFGNYYKLMPQKVIDRVTDTAKKATIELDPFTIFFSARNLAKKDHITWGKLETFLSLYGFCRNISFALLVLCLSYTLVSIFSPTTYPLYIVLTGIAGIAMFYRYLKFYRQYSLELLVSYPDIYNILQKKGEY